jgi:hypothetical protein
MITLIIITKHQNPTMEINQVIFRGLRSTALLWKPCTFWLSGFIAVQDVA